jgi:translation initiation factor IF-2
MRDRYPPHRPEQEWPGNSTSRPGISPPGDPTLRLDDPGSSSRTEGLRRLSRLTWRTTQLSAIAAAAFAVLFARSAPAHTASSQTAVRPSPAASPTRTPSPAPMHSHRAAARKKKARKAPASAAPSPAAAQPSAPPPSPTLAPPSTPPAPAPAPSPVQTTSRGSTGGG